MGANVPIVVTAGIVIVLSILACYALFTHSVNSKREKRRLLINSLKTRARKIEETMSCFPPNYLGSSLSLIIQQALVVTFEELTNLQPDEGSHKTMLQQANERFLALSKQKGSNQLKSLSNARQITGTRKNLKLLLKFFQQLGQKGALNSTKASEARNIIKNKMALLAADEHDIQARGALANGKHQLAAHYFTQANTILTKYNSDHVFNENIRNHQEWIKSASDMAKAEQDRIKAEKEALEAETKKWDDGDWKKKNFYD